MVKKNDEYVVKIEDNGFQGEGIVKIDGQVIFVPNSIKGEVVKIKILKVTSKICYAKIIEFIEKSGERVKENCDTYTRCGGCNLRHMTYEYTINIKKQGTLNTLKKALGRDIIIDEVIPMEEPYFYRNKLIYPMRVSETGDPIMGVFAERSHKIIETRCCMIQDKISQNIANDIFDFVKIHKIPVFDEKNLSGVLRHIVIRRAFKTNEVMVTLVVNEFEFPKEDEFIVFLTEKYKEIKTIIKNLNSKNTNVVLGEKNKVIFGDGYITDVLLDKRFKISNMSFYQVNPLQTEKLYYKAIEYAGLTGNETVFDLYCGIGTIGICGSKNVNKLFGIETIPDAIKDAEENAQINQVENSEFFVRKC